MSYKLDMEYHERCRSVLPPGHTLRGSSIGGGFSTYSEHLRHDDFPHAALVEFERLRADLEALLPLAKHGLYWTNDIPEGAPTDGHYAAARAVVERLERERAARGTA